MSYKKKFNVNLRLYWKNIIIIIIILTSRFTQLLGPRLETRSRDWATRAHPAIPLKLVITSWAVTAALGAGIHYAFNPSPASPPLTFFWVGLQYEKIFFFFYFYFPKLKYILLCHPVEWDKVKEWNTFDVDCMSQVNEFNHEILLLLVEKILENICLYVHLRVNV